LTLAAITGRTLQHDRDATTPETGRDQSAFTVPRAFAGADHRQAETKPAADIHTSNEYNKTGALNSGSVTTGAGARLPPRAK
jgi:hypothetical protein